MDKHTISILQLMRQDNFITTNKILIKKLGLIEATIIADLSSYYFNHIANSPHLEDKKGFFKFSKERIAEEYNITKYNVNKSLNILIKNNLIIAVKKGNPCQYFLAFHPDFSENISNFLCLNKKLKNSKLEVKKQQTSSAKTANYIYTKRVQKENNIFKEKKSFNFDSYVSSISTEYNNSIYELIVDFLNKKIHRSQRSIDENLKILENKTIEEQTTILINAIKGGYTALKELTNIKTQKDIKNAPDLKSGGNNKIVDLHLSREYAYKSLEEIKAIINNELLIQNKSDKIINIYFTSEFIRELQRYHHLSVSDIAELINYSEYEVNNIISKKY